MTSLKKMFQRNKIRLSKKKGAIVGRQLPKKIRYDLPSLGEYIVQTGKSFDDLSETELRQFLW